MPAARRSGMTTPCAPKRRGAADDRAEVARVGHLVERDDQRLLAALLAARVEQVVGVGVLVGRHPCRQALVHGAGGHPVELGLGDLQQR